MLLTIVGLFLIALSFSIQSYTLAAFTHKVKGKKIQKSFYLFSLLTIYNWDVTRLGHYYFID